MVFSIVPNEEEMILFTIHVQHASGVYETVQDTTVPPSFAANVTRA